jgi:hypothetical protein
MHDAPDQLLVRNPISSRNIGYPSTAAKCAGMERTHSAGNQGIATASIFDRSPRNHCHARRPAPACVGVSERCFLATIDVHIAWLRQKLEENPQNPKFIQTIRGVGYRFSA